MVTIPYYCRPINRKTKSHKSFHYIHNAYMLLLVSDKKPHSYLMVTVW